MYLLGLLAPSRGKEARHGRQGREGGYNVVYISHYGADYGGFGSRVFGNLFRVINIYFRFVFKDVICLSFMYKLPLLYI